MAGDDTTGAQVREAAETQASPSEPSVRLPSAARASGACPDDDAVLAYLDGRSTEAERGRIERHLDACQDCWLLVESLVESAHAPSRDAPPSAFRVTTFGIGSLIAERYQVERFIGKGGMGEVYLAHDALMNRRVALKTPLCTSTDDPSALRKFFDEARNVDRITHPNICRIYALQEHRDPQGQQPPIPFFTMEYIDGETLAQRVKRGPLPLSAIRVIARQLLEGLRAAHAKRVLHLDFKSDNIMLRRDGASVEVVLMDFGLSRQRDAALRVSQCQRGIGTLPYMALEQLEGQRNLTPAVDVYAFGVVLFEMLTGRFPFVESSLGALLMKQLRERPIAPSSLRPELSAELDAFVGRCLQRAARRRFEDAGAALLALDALPDWKKPRPAPRRGLALREALLALGCVLGSSSDSLRRDEPAVAVARAHPLTPAPARAAVASLLSDVPAGQQALAVPLRAGVRPAVPAPPALPAVPAPPALPTVGVPAASGSVAALAALSAAPPERPPAAPARSSPRARRAALASDGVEAAPRGAARKLQALPKEPIPFTRRPAPSPAGAQIEAALDSG